MTEKRFRSSPTDDNNFADVLDNEKWIGSCHVDCADDFCKKMNELNDENEQLKGKLKDILELTEKTGMTHLRKAEIKSIIGDNE